MTLPTRQLGWTGLTVSILGFGGAPLGDLYQLLDDDAALARSRPPPTPA